MILWPKVQAVLSMQKQLSGGRSKQGQDSDAKIEKVMIRMGLLKKWKQDDLKAIEGIGPKNEKLLYDANIKTWKALASASVSGLTKILEEGGNKFKLADPSTWSEQAEMADQGKWQKLTLLQDRLKGGRKV